MTMATSPHRIELRGLRSNTLGNYLAALGLFRIVASQADSTATLAWDNDVAVLQSTLDTDDLVEFFTTKYCPSPVVAPWNGSSFGGFARGATDRHAKAIGVFEANSDPRFDAIRQAIITTRSVVADPRWELGLNGSNKQRGKAAAITLLRNRLSDEAIEFLDASVALTDDRPSYPPVLGTGGNIGRLDLVVTFWERVHLVCGLVPRKKKDPEPSALLEALLSGEPTSLPKGSFGQYDAKGAGGVNEARLGDGASLTNPWIVVLAIEGSLLMATSVSRRFGSDASAAVAPFSVSASAHGFASAANAESSGGEFWAPRWYSPVTLAVLQQFTGEGRATWQGRQVRNGLGFLRSIRSLGVARGIDSFVRFGFPERNGQMRVAVPLGEYSVREDARVRITAELDDWVAHVRRFGENSAGIASLHRQIEAALFAASDSPSPERLFTVLSLVAQSEWALSRSGSALANNARPVPILTASDWLTHLDDSSAEFRVALALASGSTHPLERKRDPNRKETEPLCMAELIRPVRFEGKGRDGWWALTNRHHILGVTQRPLVDVLVDIARLRARSASAQADPRRVAFVGCQPRFPNAWRCCPGDAAAFALGALDDARLQKWLAVLTLFGPKALWDDLPKLQQQVAEQRLPAPSWDLLEPLFRNDTAKGTAGLQPAVPSEWPSLLAIGRSSIVFSQAETRLAFTYGDESEDGGAVLKKQHIPRSAKRDDLPLNEARRTLAALLVPTWTPSGKRPAEDHPQTPEASVPIPGGHDAEQTNTINSEIGA